MRCSAPPLVERVGRASLCEDHESVSLHDVDWSQKLQQTDDPSAVAGMLAASQLAFLRRLIAEVYHHAVG